MDLIVSAPWIWPMITSRALAGTCATASDARRVWRLLPAVNVSRPTSSVRAWSEFFVFAPSTGAKNTSPPLASVLSHGGAAAGGWAMAAVPFFPASGRVSCQPERLTLLPAAEVDGAADGVPLTDEF